MPPCPPLLLDVPGQGDEPDSIKRQIRKREGGGLGRKEGTSKNASRTAIRSIWRERCCCLKGKARKTKNSAEPLNLLRLIGFLTPFSSSPLSMHCLLRVVCQSQSLMQSVVKAEKLGGGIQGQDRAREGLLGGGGGGATAQI
jgi:hypothetical protein